MEGLSGSAAAYVTCAILLSVLLAVIAGVLNSVPLITTGVLNTTQATVGTTVGSAYGLMALTLVIISVAGTIGTLALFGHFGKGE